MLWYKVKETGQGTNNEEHKTFHKDQAVKSYHTEKKSLFNFWPPPLDYSLCPLGIARRQTLDTLIKGKKKESAD